MQGSKELSGEYLCLENAALSPRLMNVMPGEDGYPATIEITLPAAMTVIPFGAKMCIRDSQDAEDFMALGADRLGTSRIVKLVKGEHAEGY